MKTLKNLVKTENLNIDELMLIKGAAASTNGCGAKSCENAGCVNIASYTCTGAQCITFSEREKNLAS